ncbi:MAG TPA: mitochondrial fission ELM1 family protein [Candidatus Binatia bacterium]|nr:mitochondrial fission ELM1 family protein [Candidatus Binatia bacterium]
MSEHGVTSATGVSGRPVATTPAIAMSTVPKVWVLLGDKPGGNGQLTSLADALEWPYETKQLRYNLLSRCPNLFLGASILSVDRCQSSSLEAPWPDLVLAASRRSAPVARWIKKQSGGRARLVHLIHTQAPLHLFDLVITAPQYRLPLRPNVLYNTAPLNRPAPDRLAAAASHWQVRLGNLPRPYTALLVGGNSSVYELDPVTATKLARQASAQVRKVGGSLLVSTSPRTPASVVEAVFAALDCPAHCYRWRPNDTDNPYLAYLALADSFIVTVDSASQVVEACVTNKPVYVFSWPTRARVGDFRRRLQPQGHGMLRQSRRLAQLYDQLVYWGFIRPTRDFAASLQILTQKGLIAQLGSAPDSQPRQPLDDMERSVTRIRQLFAVHG